MAGGRDKLVRPLDAAAKAVFGLPHAATADAAVRNDDMLAGDSIVAANAAAGLATEITNRINGDATTLTTAENFATSAIAAATTTLEADGIAVGSIRLGSLAFPAFGAVLCRVASLRDFFYLARTSTATPDGITVVTALGGTGRWIRMMFADPSWLATTAWTITPSTANDEGASTLRTRSELARRLGVNTLTSPISATITASLNAGDTLMPQCLGDFTNFISWIGVPTDLLAGTGVITAYTARNGSTGQPTTMQINSLPVSWTASGLIGKVVEWTNGSGSFVRARVIEDLGSKTAALSPPIAQTTLETVFVNGTTVAVWSLPVLPSPVVIRDTSVNYSYLESAQWIPFRAGVTMTNCTGPISVNGGIVAQNNGNGTFLLAHGAAGGVAGGYHRLIAGSGTFRINTTATISSIQMEGNSVLSALSGGSAGTTDLEINAPSTTVPPFLFNGIDGGRVLANGFCYGKSAIASTHLVEMQGRDQALSIAQVPAVTGAPLIAYTIAGTTDNVSVLATRESNDISGNRVIGPAGPTVNDNRSQVIANLGSGGATATNAANIGDIGSRILAAATALEADGISTGAVQLSTLAFPATGAVVCRVATVLDFFYLARASTLTADGITVVTALGGVGRWIRLRIADVFWRSQLAWTINSSTGNDENLGDSGHPLQTRSEFYRRIGTDPLRNGTVTVTIAASLLTTDVERPGFLSDASSISNSHSFIKFVGTPRVLFTGPISAIVNRTGSTGTHTSMTLNGSPAIPGTWTAGDGVTSFLDQGVVVSWTDGANFIESRPVRDEGGKTVWLTTPMTRANLESTFTNGTTVTIFDVPSLGVDEFCPQGHVEYTNLKVVGGRFFTTAGTVFLVNCAGDSTAQGSSFNSFNGRSSSGPGDAEGYALQGCAGRIVGGYHSIVVSNSSGLRIDVTPTVQQLKVESGSVVTARVDVEVFGSTLDAVLLDALDGGRLIAAGYFYGTITGAGYGVLMAGFGGRVQFARVPQLTGTNADSANFQAAATVVALSGLSAASLTDINNNRIDGPAGPTWNDNRSALMANLGSGGSTGTNAANISDVTALAVSKTGHTAESVLVSIAGTVVDLPLTALTLVGRLGAGDVVAVPFSSVVAGGGGGSGITALTGDGTATGPGSASLTIQPGVITNAKRANMAGGTISSNLAGGSAPPVDNTLAAVKVALAISFSDIIGTLLAAQFPGLTGDVIVSAGSLVAALQNIPTGTTMAGQVIATSIAAPANPSAGHVAIYSDSTGKVLSAKDDAGNVSHTVRTKAAAASNFLTSIGADGSVTAAQPAFSDISGSASAAQLPQFTGGSVTSPAPGSAHLDLVSIPNATPAVGDIVFATVAPPASPPAGHLAIWGSNTDFVMNAKASTGLITHTVQTHNANPHEFLVEVTDNGDVSGAQPDISDLLPIPAFRTVANPTGSSAVPIPATVAQMRTMLGLDVPQTFEFELSWGLGIPLGSGSSENAPPRTVVGNWPFWMMPITYQSIITNNPYTAGNLDANLSSPELAFEFVVDQAFNTCDLLYNCTIFDPQNSGGSPGIDLIVSKNTLCDASPCRITIPAVGKSATNPVSFPLGRGDSVGVRMQGNSSWGTLGPPPFAHVKFTIKVRLMP